MYYVVNYRHCDISLLNTLVCTSNNLTTFPHDHNTILTRNKINSNPLIFFNAQSVLRFPPHLLQSVFESQFKKKKKQIQLGFCLAFGCYWLVPSGLECWQHLGDVNINGTHKTSQRICWNIITKVQTSQWLYYISFTDIISFIFFLKS